MSKLDDILEHHAGYWGNAGDMQPPGKDDLDTEATKHSIRKIIIELIKSESTNASPVGMDSYEDILSFANELITQVEAL